MFSNSDVPFKVSVSKVGKTTQVLVQNQIPGSGLPKTRVFLPTNIPVAAFLGVEVSKKGENKSINAERISEPNVRVNRSTESRSLPPCSERANPIVELKKLDLDHVPDYHREKLRDMLWEFTPMWEGSLGTIGITEHRIHLLPKTQPIAQNSYRNGLKAHKEEVLKLRRCHALVSLNPLNHLGLRQ